MAELAKVIKVRRNGVFEINGEPFPYYLSNEGATVSVKRGELPGVLVRIVADRVELVDDLEDDRRKPAEPEKQRNAS